METVAVALIAGVLGPTIVAMTTYFIRRAEKLDDNRRLDEVAAKAQEAAKGAETFARTAVEQLDQIHTLVNSDMTEARKNEKLAIEAHLHTFQRVGSPPLTEEEMATVEELRSRVAELDGILADRLAQQRKAEADLVVVDADDIASC